MRKILSSLLLLCFISSSIYAETNDKYGVHLNVDKSTQANPIYILNDSNFDLVVSIDDENRYKIWEKYECYLLLPNGMVQTDINQYRKIRFTVHVNTTEANTKIGLLIKNKQNARIFGYTANFRGVVSLSSPDRLIADISPGLAKISCATLFVSGLIIDAFKTSNIWTGEKKPFEASNITIGALILFVSGGLGWIYSDNVIANTAKPSFETLISLPYRVSNLDMGAFKKERDNNRNVYENIDVFFMQNDITENATAEQLAVVFNRLIEIPNLVQLIEDNKDIPQTQLQKADDEVRIQNKHLLNEIYPFTLAESRRQEGSSFNEVVLTPMTSAEVEYYWNNLGK